MDQSEPEPEKRPWGDQQGMKNYAWALGKWMTCTHRPCKKRKRCLGGPRGSLRKFGRPLCRVAGNDKQ